VYRFAGQLTYINSQGHLQSLAHIRPETKIIVLSFRNLFYIDIDGVDSITEMIAKEHSEIDRFAFKRKVLEIVELTKPFEKWQPRKQWGANQMVSIIRRDLYLKLTLKNHGSRIDMLLAV